MSDGHRDSLMENNSNGNPFEILQTIPVSNMEPDSSAYAVPQPRTASKSKRSRSRGRKSAPTKSLAQGISTATAKLKAEQIGSPAAQRSPAPVANDTDDLLDLFGDMAAPQPIRQVSQPAVQKPDRPVLGVSYSQPTPAANPFDFFDPLGTNDILGLQTPGNSQPASKRSSMASSVASSVDHTGELFDPNMWEMGSAASDFFDQEAEKAQPSIGLSMPGFDEENADDDEDSREESPDPEDETVNGETCGDDVADEDTKESPEPEDPPTNCLVELHRGTALLKYPRRHGFPHFKHVQLSRDNRRIQWFSKRKTLEDTCIRIADIREIRTGQKTETFQKFHQEVLEKASFSIVHGDSYRTFDVVAKSTDECNMWVKSLRKLKTLSAQGADLSSMFHMDVGIAFKDRNRPRSREGSGNFVRANNSRQLKIDPVAMKQIERDMDGLRRNYNRITQLSNRPNISRSNEYDNISQVLSELEERIEELTHEVNNTRDTDMSKRDVWRANVDLTAIGEKVEVLLKVFDANGNLKR